MNYIHILLKNERDIPYLTNMNHSRNPFRKQIEAEQQLLKKMESACDRNEEEIQKIKLRIQMLEKSLSILSQG